MQLYIGYINFSPLEGRRRLSDMDIKEPYMNNYCDPQGWWLEELWSYDTETDEFKCYYPTSSYDKDFYTTYDEELLKFNLKEALHDFNNDEDDRMVSDIIVEDCSTSRNSVCLGEAAIERIKTMSDDEIRRRIFS